MLPHARRLEDAAALLERELDGIMIATPSAQHPAQSILALQHGLAVFCQKPLARTAAETWSVVSAAQSADRLLGIDFSYRRVRGVPQMRELVQAGAIGELFAAELVFHNAYGPGKPWFYDVEQSGGGCLMDLGIHLVDLLAWVTGSRSVEVTGSRCHAGGKRVAGREHVEDYASVQLQLDGRASVSLTCSWNLHAGQDAVIEAEFFGTKGAVTLRNTNGSFYDFVIRHHRGSSTEVIARPPDAWGGRAAVAWARALGKSPAYDPTVESVTEVARVLDDIYASAGPSRWPGLHP
jgi:predicted dehydrogenase